MSISNVHEKVFNERLNITDSYTTALMSLLQKRGHVVSYRKASKQEDIDGVDWWVTYTKGDTEVPIQFKLRDKQKDIPVCRFQPFHGTAHEKTVEGRDYRCLRDQKSHEYYVAIRVDGTFKEIYRVSCKTLNDLVTKLDQEWNESSGGELNNQFPLSFFNPKRVQSWLGGSIWNKRVFRGEDGEVWWKKNFNERSPKFNMYFPYSKKEWNIVLDAEDAKFIEQFFGE